MTRFLENVLFVAAYTARSQAYAQAMARAGLAPGLTVLFGDTCGTLPGQLPDFRHGPKVACDLTLPDVSEPLSETVRRSHWDATRLSDPDVNSDAVLGLLDGSRFRLVVYSGYGGQIVKRNTLQRGIPFIHIHAGWLPRYRGSTTIYYEILLEHRCSATAILLSSRLDGGPIIARRHYALPPAKLDVDYLYEPAIRADLLIKVLSTYATSRTLPTAIEQEPEEGRTHFVIHPVLKHLAILSLR